MSQETNFTELKNDFIDKYTGVFLPEVQTVRKKRKIVNIILTTMCLITLVALFIFLLNSDITIKIGAFVIAAILAFASCKLLNIFKTKAREEIMQNFSRCIDGLAWRWGKYPEKMAVKMACLVNYFENMQVRNEFYGVHKEVAFEIIDCSLKNKINVFDGIILRLRLNRNSDVHTVIRLESTNFATTRPTLRQTQLDGALFDKKYYFYTEDEIEAKSLINGSFIEHLVNLENSFGMPFVSAAFCKGDLFIALKNKKELFALYPVLKDKPQAFEQFSSFFKNIVALYQFIDYYKSH